MKNFVQSDKFPWMYFDKKRNSWYLVKTINGLRFKKSTGTDKLMDAVKIAERIENDIRRAESPREFRKDRGQKDPTISSLWSEFMDHKRQEIQIKSVTIYRQAWENRISKYWSKKHLKDFTQSEVKKWEAWYMKKFPTTTHFNVRKSLVAFARWMNVQGYCHRILKFEKLDQKLRRLNPKETPGRVFNKLEIQRLLKACDSSNDLRTKAGIAFGVFMGLRKMEALELKRSSIYKDFDQDGDEYMAVKVWSKKNGVFRHVRIPDRAFVIIDAWLSTHDSPWIFPQKSNPKEHMASQVFDQGWRRIKIKAEIRGAEDFMAARFHDLRHTFATMTARQGWPVAIACEVLDMTIKIYMGTYVHIDPKDMAIYMRGVSLDTY